MTKTGQSATLLTHSAALVIHKEHKMAKEELLQFEGLVTENIARRPLPRSARQWTSARCLHRRKNEKESDQNPCGGSRDGRGITLRFGKGAIDLPPQGRTRRITEPPAAASPIPAPMTANGFADCLRVPDVKSDSNMTMLQSVSAIGTKRTRFNLRHSRRPSALCIFT